MEPDSDQIQYTLAGGRVVGHTTSVEMGCNFRLIQTRDLRGKSGFRGDSPMIGYWALPCLCAANVRVAGCGRSSAKTTSMVVSTSTG